MELQNECQDLVKEASFDLFLLELFIKSLSVMKTIKRELLFQQILNLDPILWIALHRILRQDLKKIMRYFLPYYASLNY